MADVIAHLDIRRDGEPHRELALDADEIIIGRATPGYQPDVVLDDPGSLISRRHCLFRRDFGSWWVEDCGSRNGTYLRRAGMLRRLDEPVQVRLDDVVCIVAAVGDAGPSSHWEIALIDPAATRTVGGDVVEPGLRPSIDRPCVRWDPATLRLEVLGDGEPRVVQLRKQGYDLVDHMVRRNTETGGEAAVCSTAELIEAVWGPEEGWDKYRPPTTDNLRDLVLAVRKAVEPGGNRPQILENQRGVGYRLHSVR